MNDLAILRLADGLARHSAARHRLVTQNIAHADTPGYRAQDVRPFSAEVADDFKLRATRAGHLAGPETARFAPRDDAAFGSESPNGNDVAIDDQLVRAAQALGNHNKATAVYKKTMDIIRASLGRGR